MQRFLYVENSSLCIISAQAIRLLKDLSRVAEVDQRGPLRAVRCGAVQCSAVQCGQVPARPG